MPRHQESEVFSVECKWSKANLKKSKSGENSDSDDNIEKTGMSRK